VETKTTPAAAGYYRVKLCWRKAFSKFFI